MQRMLDAPRERRGLRCCLLIRLTESRSRKDCSDTNARALRADSHTSRCACTLEAIRVFDKIGGA